MDLRMIEYPLMRPRVSNEVRIIAWNCWFRNTDIHANEIVDTLKSFDCDVLMLSEMTSDTQLPEKIHALGYGGVFVPTKYSHNFRSVNGGIGLFSRFAFASKPRVVPIHCRGGQFEGLRVYLEAPLEIRNNSSLVVGTTHSALPWEPGYRRCVDALLREVDTHRRQFLFAGDLNALPESTFIRTLRKRFAHLGPELSKKSYQSKGLARFIFPGWWRRLDYAFATQDVACCVKEAQLLGRNASDHKPIYIRLLM